MIASENSDLRLEEVERIIDEFFDAIVEQLAAGGRVELRGFGAGRGKRQERALFQAGQRNARAAERLKVHTSSLRV